MFLLFIEGVQIKISKENMIRLFFKGVQKKKGKYDYNAHVQ